MRHGRNNGEDNNIRFDNNDEGDFVYHVGACGACRSRAATNRHRVGSWTQLNSQRLPAPSEPGGSERRRRRRRFQWKARAEPCGRLPRRLFVW